MRNPIISIIIPVYNTEKYLRQCIDSVLNQTFTEWECILVDDGSIDESGRICDEYAISDQRIQVVHKPNEGVSIARNVGLDKARGEWIVFVDSDDWLLPDALRLMYENVVQAGADCLLAASKVLIDGNIKDCIKPVPQSYNDVLHGVIQNALWAYIFKASIIQDNNIRFIPNLAYSEDQVFLCMFALRAKTISHTDVPIYVYRKNETSACASKDGLRKARNQFEAAHQIMQCIQEYDCTERQKSLLKHRAHTILGLGYYAYASNSFSLYTYKEYEQSYTKYFSNKILLFMHTICAYITYQRRKIVTFRD